MKARDLIEAESPKQVFQQIRHAKRTYQPRRLTPREIARLTDIMARGPLTKRPIDDRFLEWGYIEYYDNDEHDAVVAKSDFADAFYSHPEIRGAYGDEWSDTPHSWRGIIRRYEAEDPKYFLKNKALPPSIDKPMRFGKVPYGSWFRVGDWVLQRVDGTKYNKNYPDETALIQRSPNETLIGTIMTFDHASVVYPVAMDPKLARRKALGETEDPKRFLKNIAPHWSANVSVSSSHGTFEIDPNGKVVHFDLSDNEEGKALEKIEKFDLHEWRCYWQWKGELPGGFDILDLGFWTKDGAYEPPEQDWREEIKQLGAVQRARG
jgi:hypothetical protein